MVVLVVILADGLLDSLLLGISGLEPAEEDDDFPAAGGTVDSGLPIGSDVVGDALACMGRAVPQ